MNITSKNKRIIINLILGIVWTTLGIVYFFDPENSRLKAYVTIAVGIAYLLMTAYQYFYKKPDKPNNSLKI
nr:hypothetical protein [uncultured Chryseobacterium sp.]